ncbi:diaminobutyrate--2-oxoglutarate transaminase [Evansella sp. LMS18]|uniref:diaminobutyrate--2-oxoglutarate transaminase n=1 Tax=Evansella sp. LMS18 TaxID=2924033 RepID=UPI0020D1E5E7|nr:diaminobutyrate--2-oxoglutarate transaminase [Evansella sp. LMS18]UTR10148.1 diaminobutyrate--2-oxoglutarate transaminase [Evansella sp. LMS18]
MKDDLTIFEELESNVRSYIRGYPAVFTKAKGSKIWDKNGKEYIDFFSGAGALNYGHNEPVMKEKLVKYMLNDGITHSLDMATAAKADFLKKFNEVILKPRNLDYKIMFTGPTGTNSVEAALKIARKATGRTDIICFTNGFHGMTLGSLSVTGNIEKRKGAGLPLTNSVTLPFDHGVNEEKRMASLDYLERYLEISSGKDNVPAGMILETVQGEGGLNTASFEWLKRTEEICRKWGVLLIIDDIQAGVGRTGTYFSFEPAGIKPDIICLSKSLGGFGLPLAITLLKPELDLWKPGEHNGTFRGNNHAFITAAASLSYWEDDSFEKSVQQKASRLSEFLNQLAVRYPELKGKVCGRGLMQGVSFQDDGFASKVMAEAFNRGLIIETSGSNGQVLKLLPPLTIEEEDLQKGLQIIEESIKAVK